jgi:hypothetical protein
VKEELNVLTRDEPDQETSFLQESQGILLPLTHDVEDSCTYMARRAVKKPELHRTASFGSDSADLQTSITTDSLSMVSNYGQHSDVSLGNHLHRPQNGVKSPFRSHKRATSQIDALTRFIMIEREIEAMKSTLVNRSDYCLASVIDIFTGRGNTTVSVQEFAAGLMGLALEFSEEDVIAVVHRFGSEIKRNIDLSACVIPKNRESIIKMGEKRMKHEANRLGLTMETRRMVAKLFEMVICASKEWVSLRETSELSLHAAFEALQHTGNEMISLGELHQLLAPRDSALYVR